MSSSAAAEYLTEDIKTYTGQQARYVTPDGNVVCHPRKDIPETRVLLPMKAGSMWREWTTLQRKVVWLPTEMNDPDRQYRTLDQAPQADEEHTIRCISSEAGNHWHMPMFDVDVERLEDTVPVDSLLGHLFQAPRYWLPSRTHWHVYIDTPGTVPGNRGIAWYDYEVILEFLAARSSAGGYGIDPGWAWYSKREKKATLRDPLRRERLTLQNARWCCMWCAEPFDSEALLDAHEAECG